MIELAEEWVNLLTMIIAMILSHFQLLDELAILWVIVASYWLWFPQVS